MSKLNNDDINNFILNEALSIAHNCECSAIALFDDTSKIFKNSKFSKFDNAIKLIIVGSKSDNVINFNSCNFIKVKSFSNTRMANLRNAILICLLKKYINPDEKICCIGGISGSNRLDNIMIFDVKNEFHAFLQKNINFLSNDASIETLLKVLEIATELSIDGHEGKSIGSMFVIGEKEKLAPFVHQLILNPFFGYTKDERNIIKNDNMSRTIKEYSSLDGAFVIDSNGSVESAGSLIHTSEIEELPSGFGSRHVAAISIAKKVDCIAITVSSSTKQVTLYKNETILNLYDNSRYQAYL